MAKSERASEFELQERILAVAKAMLGGYSKRRFLIQHVTKTYDWGVSVRQLDNYIAGAKELIINSYSEDDLVLEKDIAINRLEALFTMNMKIQDYREARNVTIDRMKLMGFMNKQEIELKGQKVIINFADEKD